MNIIQVVIDVAVVLAIGGIGYWLGHDKGVSDGRSGEFAHQQWKLGYKEGYDDAKHNRTEKIENIDDEYDDKGYLLER